MPNEQLRPPGGNGDSTRAGSPADGSLGRDFLTIRERAQQLITSSRELRRRAETLGAAVHTTEEYAVAAVHDAMATLGASAGMAWRINGGNGELHLLGATGVSDAMLRAQGDLTAQSDHPVGEVLRTGQTLVLPEGEWRRRFPALAVRLASSLTGTIGVAPITRAGRLYGAVMVCFAPPGQLRKKEGVLLRSLAARLARALANSRLYFAERDARDELVRARRAAERARDEADAARREAEAANRAKDEFIAIMSHELRTPLTAILGYSELLADGIFGEINSQQQDLLRRMREGGNQLLAHIEALLGLTRVRAGREDVVAERFMVADVVRRAVTVTAPQAERKRLQLRTELPEQPIEMYSDAQKVLQILVNLIGNAVKFTRVGEVTVHVRAEPDVAPGARGAMLRIVVRDTGVGIEAANQARVFDPFWQADQRLVRGHGGAGLGLAIVRAYAQLLGGEVSLESREGEGSSFTVLLPLVAPFPEQAR